MFRLKRPSAALLISCAALFLALGGGAYAATSLIGHNQLAPNSVWHNNIGKGSVRMDNLSKFIQGRLAKEGTPGPQGATGPQGPAGKNGTNGTNGVNAQGGATAVPGLSGAFYSVEFYDNPAGAGAIATAACDPNSDTNSQNFVAISGGVTPTGDGQDLTANAQDLPVVASFPGRMDWTTNAPKAGRLDGWIVKLAHSGGQQDTKMEVWALCVPVSSGISTTVVRNGSGN